MTTRILSLAILCGFVVMGMTGTAEATVFFIHQGNNDPATEAGDTGLNWGASPLTAYSATDLGSDGNPIGEDSLGDPPDSAAGWVFRDNAFADAGLDGSQPWQAKMRVKWLSNNNNLYLADGQTSWTVFFMQDDGEGPGGIFLRDSSDNDHVIMPDPEDGQFHDLVMQYRPNDATEGDRVEISVDGVHKLTRLRSEMSASPANYLGFGGHSHANLAWAESYWSHVELNDVPEPASMSLILLGMCGLMTVRRRLM